MADETTIPLLPCVALGETLRFSRTLGFEVTHEQETPYVYAAVHRGGVALHFHRPKGKGPKLATGACLVMVPGVATYHRAFADALRAGYGRVPTAGLPRITRLGKGQTRFTAFDPSGNALIHIDRDEPPIDYGAYTPKPSRLARAIESAAFMRDTYTDDRAAAQVLRKALAVAEPADPIDLALALASLAELAVAMGDMERARALRAELHQLPLSDDDRERHRDELQAADELERWIHSRPPAPEPS